MSEANYKEAQLHSNAPQYKVGDKVKLDGILFSNSQTHCGMKRTGEWYIYDGKLVNGRYRVTNLESRINKYPVSVNCSGYVEPSDTIKIN